MSRDFGDFQTPTELVHAILACLTKSGKTWERVLEPTCGQGNFIEAVLSNGMAPREVLGIEIQDQHAEAAKRLCHQSGAAHVSILKADIFRLDLGRDLQWQDGGALLVIGNPPWVTNTELSAHGSTNLPHKTNLKNLPGFEAMTGSSNFDIAEYIWLKLIRELAGERPTIGLLCKTLVARNVLQFAAATDLPISNAVIRRIDAKRWFNAAVDACFFCLDVGQGESRYEADIYADLESEAPIATIAISDGKLVSNVANRAALAVFDGVSPLTWRQGLKHDAASVVELTVDEHGTFQNKLGDTVQVEGDYVFPLLKSSDLGGNGNAKPKRAVVVPQKRMGEDTLHLARTAPHLWRYLTGHRAAFERRKSSIYRNQPPFAYFGIGEYSFAPYKVAISGMYKVPIFRAIGPRQGQPVMFDDTCYFIACSSGEQAALVASLLNDPICLDFLETIAFWDAKRPITKKLLQRIDLLALLQHVDKRALLERATSEVKRLESIDHHQVSWPSSLESLLVEQSTELPQVMQLAMTEAQ